MARMKFLLIAAIAAAALSLSIPFPAAAFRGAYGGGRTASGDREGAYEGAHVAPSWGGNYGSTDWHGAPPAWNNAAPYYGRYGAVAAPAVVAPVPYETPPSTTTWSDDSGSYQATGSTTTWSDGSYEGDRRPADWRR
jgi:hypothetical protein